MVDPAFAAVNSPRPAASGRVPPGPRAAPSGSRGARAREGGGFVALALGSNLGDRAAYLAFARARLEAAGCPAPLASPVEETEPVGPPGQGPYLNQVLACPLAEVALAPRALLEAALGIERAAGRERRVRWGPRTLDIDLLLYGALVLDEPGLTLPHPRLVERPFLLLPLARLIPAAVHPVAGRTIADLAAGLLR